MAAGGVTTVVGGLVYLKAKSDISDVESKCPNRICPVNQPALVKQGENARSRATTGTIVTIGGLVVAAGGVVWFLLDSNKSSQTAQYREPAVSPWLGVGTAGVSWQGRF